MFLLRGWWNNWTWSSFSSLLYDLKSPLLFIFHSGWSKCTLPHSWSKVRVQARTEQTSWLLETASLSGVGTQYTTQPFHNTWTGVIFTSALFFLPVHALTMGWTFLMLSVFLSVFNRVGSELHGKLFNCLIILAHHLICSGGILHWDTCDLPELVRGDDVGSTI